MKGQTRTGTFVLNLDRSSDRMEWMASQLAAFGIPYSRMAAMDAERDNLDAALRSFGVRIGKPKERPLGRAEIACYLTHLATFRLAIAKGYAAILVLEDDVEILADLNPVLDQFAEFEDKPYILKLEPWKLPNWQVTVAKFATIDVAYTPEPIWLAASYCISRAAMKRAVARLTELRNPIDHELCSYSRAGLTVLLSSPPLAIQKTQHFGSLLEAERAALEANATSLRLRMKKIWGLQKFVALYENLIWLVRPFWQASRQSGVRTALRLRFRSPRAPDGYNRRP